MQSTITRTRTDRQLRAYAQSGDYQLLDTSTPGQFKVINPKGRPYLTTVNSCTCPDARPSASQPAGHRCKHQYLVQWHIEASQPAPAPAAASTAAPTRPEPGCPPSPEWRAMVAARRRQDFPDD